MSKELETLSIIRLRLRQSEKLFEDIFASNDEPIKETLKELKDAIKSTKIIETALKNYEKLTSKPVIWCGRTHGQTQAIIDYICKNYKEVKITNLEDDKKLKALEIIKETPIFAWYVTIYKDAYEMISDAKGFRVNNSVEELQQMFDLLKEALL